MLMALCSPKARSAASTKEGRFFFLFSSRALPSFTPFYVSAIFADLDYLQQNTMSLKETEFTRFFFFSCCCHGSLAMSEPLLTFPLFFFCSTSVCFLFRSFSAGFTFFFFSIFRLFIALLLLLLLLRQVSSTGLSVCVISSFSPLPFNALSFL